MREQGVHVGCNGGRKPRTARERKFGLLLKQNLYSAPKPVTGKARPFLDTTPFAASSAARSRASCSSQKGSSYFPALLSRQVFANCLGDLQVLRTFAPLQPQKFRKNKFIKTFGGRCFLKCL